MVRGVFYSSPVNMLIQFISRHATRPIRLCLSLGVYIRVHFPQHSLVLPPRVTFSAAFPAREIASSHTSAQLSCLSDIVTFSGSEQ